MSSTSINPAQTANDVSLSPLAQATGAINDKYTQLGGEASVLGRSTTEVQPAPDGVGFFQPFQSGSIYWHPATGAHEVHGDILGKWSSMGWERSLLGYPVTDETTTPDGIGRFNHFQSGTIYWTPKTGAHEVHGDILGRWSSMGWERSILGYPVTDETTTPDGIGRFNHFQGGSIYWTPKTGAHEVHGDILGKWSSMGWERSILGYPLTDETTTPDGIGRFNHFQGGSIYWTPKTGAHEVNGDILGKWSSMGWERSFLGYPTSDELNTSDGAGRISHFQHGDITWITATRAVTTSPATMQFHSDIATQDWLPMGGWVNVAVNTLGQFTVSGHMHDSGFPNIDYALAIVIMTPSGMGYTFARQNHVDGTVTLFGRNRDDDWTIPEANPQIAQNWDEVTQARLFWRLTAQDTLSAGIQGLIEDVAKDGVKALGAAGISALIALI